MEIARLNSDGGVILELNHVLEEPVSGPEVANKAFLYYLKGIGFRVKLFGQDGEPLTEANVSVILEKQTVDPDPLSNKGQLFAKTDGGRVELFYMKDNGDVVQLTPTAAGVSATDVQVFDTPGAHTWTKPADAKSVRFTLIGGGGGGGSGRRGAPGSARGGGGGGGAGSKTICEFNADDLPATLTINVGAGGTGGAAPTVENTDGNAGTNGGVSTVIGTGVSIHAENGTGGGGGADSTGGSAGSGNTTGTYKGGSGTIGSDGSLNAATPTNQDTAPAGGGGGGGISAADAAKDAANGGHSERAHNFASGGTKGDPGDPGTDTTVATDGFSSGGGGGGGAGIGEASGRGGDAEIGAGGGGAGAQENGTLGGRGGNGGGGIVVVTTYF